MWGKQRAIVASVISLLALLVVPATVLAATPQSSSSNYSVNEVFFGAGGALNDCSTNYCAKESLGSTGVGKATSPNYQVHAGFNTDRMPYLKFVVNGANINVGALSTGSTTTANATFSVKSYLSSGYQVVTVSNPPQNNSFTMHALSTPTASSAGAEQFGMNLVANACPTPSSTCSGSLGANPQQVPSSAFSFGQAASGYNTPNLYKYAKGDIIADSSSSSGETDYTISYIYNISVLTPGGTYKFNDVLVATATF